MLGIQVPMMFWRFNSPIAEPFCPGLCTNPSSLWSFQSECFLLLLCKSQQDLRTVIMPSYVSLISRAFSIFTTVEMWNDYHRIYDVDSHPSSMDIDRVVCLCVLFSKTNNLVLLMLSITLFSVHLISSQYELSLLFVMLPVINQSIRLYL